MKIKSLNCPACSAPVSADLKPNQQFTCSACHSTLVLTDLVTDDQILCANCKTLNQDNKQFCKNCGKKLKTGCPFCYVQNSVDVTHCKNCGAHLGHARKRKHQWLNKQRQHQKDRRTAWKEAEARNRKIKLQKLLDDLDEPENHPMAIYQLHQFGNEAVESLIALLEDDDPDARFGAARTLGLIGDTRCISPLIDSLDDEEPAVRYWSIDTLAKLNAKDAITAIGNLLDDEHKGVKAHAFKALEKLGGPEADALLKQKKRRKWWPF